MIEDINKITYKKFGELTLRRSQKKSNIYYLETNGHDFVVNFPKVTYMGESISRYPRFHYDNKKIVENFFNALNKGIAKSVYHGKIFGTKPKKDEIEKYIKKTLDTRKSTFTIYLLEKDGIMPTRMFEIVSGKRVDIPQMRPDEFRVKFKTGTEFKPQIWFSNIKISPNTIELEYNIYAMEVLKKPTKDEVDDEDENSDSESGDMLKKDILISEEPVSIEETKKSQPQSQQPKEFIEEDDMSDIDEKDFH
jgi:hypothetical protein